MQWLTKPSQEGYRHGKESKPGCTARCQEQVGSTSWALDSKTSIDLLKCPNPKTTSMHSSILYKKQFEIDFMKSPLLAPDTHYLSFAESDAQLRILYDLQNLKKLTIKDSGLPPCYELIMF